MNNSKKSNSNINENMEWNENNEFKKIKRELSIKTIVKIIIYSLLTMLLLAFLVDVIYNDELANSVIRMNERFYYFCVMNKETIISVTCIIIILGYMYIFLRKLIGNIEIILIAIDKLLKNPEQEIDLPESLLSIENRLNKIRIDLITSRNEAKEAESKKNDLIVYMAHDLKTPLTSIIGYLTLLTEEKEISKRLQDKYINIALDKALRVEELTNQFFDITRYNLHSMPITKKELNVSYLLRQLIDECFPMLEEKNLKCNMEADEKIMIFADGDKLARAFDNLLKNAINYSFENTEIEIKVKEEDEKINILFRNRGEKIPEYKLDKIFEKFYRGDSARSSSTGGAGLGLAITKEIIELHGGKIFVKNDDEFIEFYIILDKV